MLKELLESKKCFKLICGAGNENLCEIENLVAIYAAAGCHFFDLAADIEVLKAAQRGLDFAVSKENQKDYYFCVSVGTSSDQHMQKAKIQKDKCRQCGICIGVCPQNAIDKNFEVVEDYCIGCFRCKSACKFSAIDGYAKVRNLDKIIKMSQSGEINLNCIELHASSGEDKVITALWTSLCENFSGMLSLCLGRKDLSNTQIFSRIRRLISIREPYTTIIQADGSPMSGGIDDFNSTIQAVAMSDLIAKLNLPVYIIPSGGTNSKTATLANQCNIDINGVAVGSFARKIVSNIILNNDLKNDKLAFEHASKIAANLINSILN